MSGSSAFRVSESGGARPDWIGQISVCHAVLVPFDSSAAQSQQPAYVLGIDTCGPTGSVALGQWTAEEVEVLSLVVLEGRTYSTTLVTAIADLLAKHGMVLKEVSCLVVVNGPGSFTGVRVGVSAAKGLAEGLGIPIVAVSRLEVLARKGRVETAALDAHRHEVYLRLEGRELLAGEAELAAFQRPGQVAVCDPDALALLQANWPSAALIDVSAPNAADALHLAAPLVHSRQFADISLLDGHYLRRSDAEIFGDSGAARIAGVPHS